MKLIIGLGNPEPNYDLTRHNIGFMIINDYCQNQTIIFKSKVKYQIAEANILGEKVIFIKPSTYMNLSGEAIKSVVDFYKISIEDIIVIYDDLDLEFNTLRIKKNSSSGGHNGIKSTINHLGTQDFLKLKVGINNQFKADSKSFVLNKFTKKEQLELKQIYQRTSKIIDEFIKGSDGFDLMNLYN